MKKEDIIRKLTSRKLWVAVAGFVGGADPQDGVQHGDRSQYHGRRGYVGERVRKGDNIV